MLAKQAGDVPPRRAERVVDGGGNEKLDHRLAAPAVRPGILPRPIHVTEARADDDAGRKMIAGARQRTKGWQRAQRYVHPEGAGAVAPLADTLEKTGRQRIRRQ